MIWTLLYYFTLAYIGYYAVKLIRFFISVENQRRKCRNIPGPEALPLIGSLHKFPKELPKLEAYFQEESRKFIESGSNLMKIWYGPIMRIYPLDSEAVKPITNSNVEIVKSEEYDYLRRWLGNDLLTSHGEHWQQKRKLLTPAFHFQKLEEYNQIIDYHTCIQILSTRAKDEQEIDFIHYAKYLTLDIIMQTAMGIHLNLQEDNNHPYVKAVTKFGDLLNMRIMNPFFTIPIVWKLLGYENETQKVLQILKGMSTHVIEERMHQTSINDGEQKRRPDFLGILLQQKEENQMSVEELREQVDTFLFAGHDTTSHAISWTIWCLATNPDKQERLYREIIGTFGQSDAEFCTNKLKELKYLDAVIKESMRIYPPVPFIGRTLQNDVQVGENLLPKGTSIIIPQMFIHHNQKVFPNHWDFEPENFLNGQEYPSNAYIPFSAGPRNCIGMRFAQSEVRITIAHLILNFQFSSPHKMTDNWTNSEMILRPGIGIPVHLKRRF